MSRSALGLIVPAIAALLLAPARARAAEPPDPARVEFRWDAPEQSCPSEEAVLGELERLLGAPLASYGGARTGDTGGGGPSSEKSIRLTAIARVRQEADGRWDLRLWTITDEATRQRSMTGEDCAVLAEAAALLAAMTIDPSVLERMGASEAAVEQAEQAEEVAEPEPVETDPEPEPDPEPDPEPTPEPDPPVEPIPTQPEPEPGRRFAIALRAHAGVSIADLPGAGPIVRLAFALQWEHARFELEGHYAFVREARFDDAADRGADLQAALGIARGCGLLRQRKTKLEFPLCAGVEAGALFGEGVGYPETNRGSIPWLALDLAPGLVWAPIPHFALGLSLEPFLALLRPSFPVEGTGPIYRPSAGGLRVLAGVEARF